MQLILNEYAPFLRRSHGYLKNLFDGFQTLEILELDIGFIRIKTEHGIKEIIIDCEGFQFSKFKTEKYIEILILLEEEIRGYISEVLE